MATSAAADKGPVHGHGRAGAVRACLQLMRPANMVTAAADVIAGYAVAGPAVSWKLFALAGSGMALYAGGVVLNDYFDRDIDARERPERPIPSGRIPSYLALALGVSWMLLGILAAFCVSPGSGMLALYIALLAVIYDAWAKKLQIVGPVFMGLCRGLNLFLGVSVVPAACGEWWFLALLPLVYIAGITAMSRGEVKGGSREMVLAAFAAMGAVFGGVVSLGFGDRFRLAWAALFLLFLGYRILPAMGRAWNVPDAAHLRAAVKSGVLSLIVLDAAIAAGFAGPVYGLAILALLGVAALLARPFAVT